MRSRSFFDLVELVARLRDPASGCPWDRVQDHLSLRPYMLEEAYEAIAAMEGEDPKALADELGDVLLQVLLHSQIASEQGDFSVEEVIEGLSCKLTRRHPHVFGDAPNDLPAIKRRWEEIKCGEKPKTTRLPILVRARKTVHAMAKLGRMETVDESDSSLEPEERAGVRILAAIKQAWKDGFDAELALRKALDRIERGTDR